MDRATRSFLDHAATSPIRPEAREAVLAALDSDGNPSSVHAEGRAARARIEAARREIAAAIGATGLGELVFTSGATEANATVLRAPGAILASAIEHPSVLAQEGVRTLPVEASGRLDLAALRDAIEVGGVRVLALMLVNNETGVVQPVARAASIARAHGVHLHVDAVQALGKMPIDVDELGCDSLALSAHKIGGPKGIGALWLRDGDRVAPLIRGGGQEGRRRAGTEATSQIAGFAAALRAIDEDEPARLEALRAYLESCVLDAVPEAVVVGAAAPRAAHVTALALPGMAASTQVMALDLGGVAVSAGAACSSGKVTTSHVLAAMGLAADLVASTIRVSVGWSTTRDDIERFVELWAALAKRRRAA